MGSYLRISSLVEDFAGAFVETLVMERAKFAAYAMRAPFLLSEWPPSPREERRGQRDRDESGGDMLSLSPDLNDSVHVVSLAAHACATTMRKLRHMRPTHESDDGHTQPGAGACGQSKQSIQSVPAAKTPTATANSTEPSVASVTSASYG